MGVMDRLVLSDADWGTGRRLRPVVSVHQPAIGRVVQMRRFIERVQAFPVGGWVDPIDRLGIIEAVVALGMNCGCK